MSSKTLRLGMGQKASSRSGTARTVGVGRGSSRGVEAVNFAALRQSAPPSLPARQAEVADLVAHGLCDCEIAAELGVTENTVGSYLKLIFKRYGVHTRTALTARLLTEGDSESVDPSRGTSHERGYC